VRAIFSGRGDMVLAHGVREFETEHLGVEFHCRPSVLATESGVVELFAKHAILLNSAAKVDIININMPGA
jgi:hypothetical protein